MGRPRGQKNDDFSLRYICKRLERLLDRKVEFIEDFMLDRERILNAKKAKVFLLENIRFFEEETKNGMELGKNLAELCDVYINDAFGTSHRKHSSTYAITNYVDQKVAGFLLKREIDTFAKALFHPIKPICLVIGDAKVSLKITLLRSIMPKIDKLIIGRAMSNTIIWNGPMGIFEIDRFSKGAFRIAHAIADTYAYSIVGGGDTISAVLKAEEKENISFMSTGGGASLELLEGKLLPGFENLDKY